MAGAGTARVVGTDELGAAAGDMHAGLPEAVARAHTDVADSLLAERVRAFAPRRTERLLDAIAANRVGDEVTVDVDVEYASFVEYGTRRMAPRLFVERALATLRDAEVEETYDRAMTDLATSVDLV